MYVDCQIQIAQLHINKVVRRIREFSPLENRHDVLVVLLSAELHYCTYFVVYIPLIGRRNVEQLSGKRLF